MVLKVILFWIQVVLSWRWIKDKTDKKLPYTIKIKGQKKAIEIRESVCDNLVEMD
jgi:hypothetical protein